MNAVAADRPSSPLQAVDVLTRVKDEGAKAVAEELWKENDTWNEVMTNVGRGDPQWLKVAASLRPGTDGGAAEMLDEAVFLALKPAPLAVLNLLKSHEFETTSVCSSNVGADYPAAKSRRFIALRIKVLESVSEPTVREMRDQCLAGLRAALRDFAPSPKGHSG